MNDWRDLTDEEREALEPGEEGWRYPRGTELPKGQFIERLRETEVFKSGAVCTAIRWCSNGVGAPSMQLIGSTRDMADPVYDRSSGYYPLPRGAYIPFVAKPRAKPAPDDGGMVFGNIKGPMQKAAKGK